MDERFHLHKLLEQYVPEIWRKSYGTLRGYIEVHRLKRHWTSRRGARGTGSALVVVESAASRYTRCIRPSLSSSSRTRTQRILAVHAHKRRRVYDTATANGARGPWPKFFSREGGQVQKKRTLSTINLCTRRYSNRYFDYFAAELSRAWWLRIITLYLIELWTLLHLVSHCQLLLSARFVYDHFSFDGKR